MNWGGGMGFDLGDADVGAAPVAVLKNDLFDEISSQEGSFVGAWMELVESKSFLRQVEYPPWN